MATVRDLVYAALEEINVTAQGEVPTTAEAQKALDVLGRLQDRWSTERLYLFTVTRTLFTITQATSFSVGSGGDINITRPTYIDAVHLVDTSSDPDGESPLGKMLEEDYRNYPTKAGTAAIPSSWYYSPTYPLGALYLIPIPTSSGFQGAVYAPTPVTKYTSLDTSVSLPPGYEELIVSNLAVRCAPTFGAQVHPELKAAAATSLAHIKRLNRRRTRLKFDPELLSPQGKVYDIMTDF